MTAGEWLCLQRIAAAGMAPLKSHHQNGPLSRQWSVTMALRPLNGLTGNNYAGSDLRAADSGCALLTQSALLRTVDFTGTYSKASDGRTAHLKALPVMCNPLKALKARLAFIAPQRVVLQAQLAHETNTTTEWQVQPPMDGDRPCQGYHSQHW